MNTFSLRQIRTEDIDELLEIADKSGLSPWSRQNYVDELARGDSIMLLAKSESGLVEGFIIGRLILGESDDHPFEAEIYNIAVRETSRRSGAGKMLLDTFIERCKSANAGRIWLEVRLSNIGAIAFYKRIGFTMASTRWAFYSNPVEDAIVMKLDLAKSTISL